MTGPSPWAPLHLYEVLTQYTPGVQGDLVREWATTHQDYAQKFNDAADASQRTYLPLFDELLQGYAGQTAQSVLNEIVKSWCQLAAAHQDAAKAMTNIARCIDDLTNHLTSIYQDYGTQYENIVNLDPNMADNLLLEAEHQADLAQKQAIDNVTQILKENANLFDDVPPFPGGLTPNIWPENPDVPPQWPVPGHTYLPSPSQAALALMPLKSLASGTVRSA